MHIERIAIHIPSERRTVAEVVECAGGTDVKRRVYERYYQLQSVAVADDLALEELLSRPLTALFASGDHDPGRVTRLLYAHTFAHNRPFAFPLLHSLRRRHGLVRAVPMSVTMGNCASAFLALALASSALADDANATTIILAGEKCFYEETRTMPFALMAEASAAALLTPRGTHNRLLGMAVSSDGRFYASPRRLGTELTRDFYACYDDLLLQTVKAALADAAVAMSSVRLLVPHNVNIHSTRRLAENLCLPMERIMLELLPTVGHAFCADIFLNLEMACASGRIQAGDIVVACCAGMGATFAAAVFSA